MNGETPKPTVSLTRIVQRFTLVLAAILGLHSTSAAQTTIVPVTASVGSFTPYPVAVGEDATAPLSATASSPPGGSNSTTSPVWSWTIENLQFSADDTTYGPPPPNAAYAYINHPSSSSPVATLVLNCVNGGYWKVVCRVTVSWSAVPPAVGFWAGTDAKDAKEKAVEIEKLIIDGSMPENEGPATTVVGSAITIRAKPKAPDTFPAGKPTWEVTVKPVGSTVANPATGATATITPDKVGKYTVKATCGTSTKTFTILAVNVVLTSLEFTSDHNVLCDGKDLVTAGARFPDVEWTSAGVNVPITHTAGDATKVSVKLTLKVGGVPANTAYEIKSTSDEKALTFTKNGMLSPGNAVVIEITGTDPIKKDIRKINSAIAWTIALAGEAATPLATTGPHVIYTTLGTPDTSGPVDCTKPNVPRMELAVPKMADAIKAAGSYTNYAKIVWELNKANGAYFLGRNLDDKKAWRLPEVSTAAGAMAYDGKKEPGADCISIARFVRNVCMVMGVPGTFDAKTFMAYYKTAADPNRPKKALEGNLSNPNIKPNDQGVPSTPGLGADWILGLADSNCTNAKNPAAAPGTVGCGPSGLNGFEAAVIYTQGGNTWYIPGGTQRIYNDKDKVVQIFQTMVWVAAGDHDGNPATPDVLVVKAVDFTYTIPANDVP